MPRPLLRMPELKQQTQTQTTNQLQLRQPEQKTQTRTQLNQMQIQRVLNRKRSSQYMQAMTRLDAGGHMHNQHQVQALIDVIREEMPEIDIDLGPIGIVSKCYLGEPYEVHSLDVMGNIIEHYESWRPMPDGMEKARRLASSGMYSFIEIYHHEMRAVSANGNVAVLKE